MQNFSYFLDVFGKITVKDVALFIAAVVFLVFCYRKVSKYMVDRYEANKQKDAQLAEALESVRKYPEWHQQSLNIQKKLNDDIEANKGLYQAIEKRLAKIEEDFKHRERNKLRESLIQSYRYYTSKEKNPMQAWSEMEADAFWKSFGDYEDVDGNGHIHTEVQPAMRLLEVIPMHETERIEALMHSRG